MYTFLCGQVELVLSIKCANVAKKGALNPDPDQGKPKWQMAHKKGIFF
jgi:hypothetical protein